ncbi:MAG: hypothetical protein WC509_08365 [Candidatus Izemoplasmatales bacterium]
MISLVFIALIFIAAYVASGFIRKHDVALYVAATVLSALALVFRTVPATLPFNRGYLGFSLFYVVMIVGLFSRESVIFKRLSSVRQVLSILGFIVLTPHAVFFVLDRIAGDASLDPFGVAAYLIMVPLFVTSFRNPPEGPARMKWKKLQRFAYVVYLAVFVHLVLVSELPNLAMYIVLFVPYLVYKPIHFFRHERPYYLAMRRKMAESSRKGGKKAGEA